jgi:selenocysteine-specific elongation factor
MKHFILGTAGHVDHGKTALVKALTGIDTDRLKEEKERGITIDLGFAPLKLPDGRIIGIVDVPGHERFIKNMVAGAAGMDLVMLVIAADEGVMPQTREHMAICSLLGISRGFVVISKTDLVDAEWLALVADEVREFLRGTFLEGAPIVAASAMTGNGLQAIIDTTEQLIEKSDQKIDAGIFRLPIDRAFSMKGFGTVITGTLVSGRVESGETVEVFPSGRTAKIRGIQVHNSAVAAAEAGQRTAVNLQGLEKEAVERGEVLGRPGTLIPARRLDVSLRYIPVTDKKFKNRTVVRLHTGTSEVMAKVILLDRDDMAPGTEAWAQLLTDRPVVTIASDRFVIRSSSPVTTLGGGIILDPLAKKHRQHGVLDTDTWRCLAEGTPEKRVAEMIGRAESMGLTVRELTVRTGLSNGQLNHILERMLSLNSIVRLDRDENRVISRSYCEVYQQKLIDTLEAYHRRFPLKDGISREELRSHAGRFVSPKLFHWAIQSLEKARAIVTELDLVRLPSHQVRLQEGLGALRSEIEDLYIHAGLSPPTAREIFDRFVNRKNEAWEVLKVMIQDGTLIKVSEDLFFHKHHMNRLREDYRALIIKEGRSTPASFRNLTGLSRKFIIPLMEYFDLTKLTIRTGEYRILREKEGK